MSASSRDSESWGQGQGQGQGHGGAAGDSSRSPAGEREGQIQAGFPGEENQEDGGGRCLYSCHPLSVYRVPAVCRAPCPGLVLAYGRAGTASRSDSDSRRPPFWFCPFFL